MGQGLLPEGEALRRAIRWIGDRRREDPQLKLAKVIDEATFRFDLSPLESDWLWQNIARLSSD